MNLWIPISQRTCAPGNCNWNSAPLRLDSSSFATTRLREPFRFHKALAKRTGEFLHVYSSSACAPAGIRLVGRIHWFSFSEVHKEYTSSSGGKDLTRVFLYFASL